MNSIIQKIKYKIYSQKVLKNLGVHNNLSPTVSTGTDNKMITTLY